jgi:hypothetical protein
MVFARHGRSVAPTPLPRNRGGKNSSSRSAMVCISADAAAIVTSVARRPKTVSRRSSRAVARGAAVRGDSFNRDSVPSGIQNCVPTSHPRGPLNEAGATPIISKGSPEIATVAPTIRGSDANRRRHSVSLSITTRPPPASSLG